jgi:sulfatase maturation enzyme AslB (radical SAM superfamily)
MSTTTTTELLPDAAAVQASPAAVPSFLELEIAGFCQLKCVHCYAESGPDGGRGTMTTGDWERVIDQAAAIGVKMVQFIGGNRPWTLTCPGSSATHSARA